MDGWIKLHRRILEHEMLKDDPIARHIFTDMLLLANPRDGSFLAGKRYLARISGFHPSTVYKVINRLAREGMVEPQSNHKGTKILICNWARWQPQSNHKGTVLKNKEERSIDKYLYSPESKKIWYKLWLGIKEQYPYTKEKTPEQHKANCHEIEKLHRLDGYEYGLIEQVVDWVLKDPFWRPNIQSGSKLREKFKPILDRMVEERRNQKERRTI